MKSQLNLNGDWEGRCNNILWNCTGDECDFHYPNKEVMECPICGTVRSYCKAYPMKGREKCRVHGGKALRGINHPQYKGVGYSKHLPTRLLEQFVLAVDNPNVLDGTEDIALLQTRLQDLLGRIENENWGIGLWDNLLKSFNKFQKAKIDATNTGSTRAVRKMDQHLKEIEKVINRGSYEAKIWQEILSIQERMRRIRDTEMKRRKEAAEIITADQFRTFLGFIMNAITTRVSDEKERGALLNDIEGLFNTATRQPR